MRALYWLMLAIPLAVGCGDGNGKPNLDYLKNKCSSVCEGLEGYFDRCSFDYFEDGECEADCFEDVEDSEVGCESEIAATLDCYSGIFWHQVACTADALDRQLDTCSEEEGLWNECEQSPTPESEQRG